jgi:hypothetical protein
MNKKYVYNFLKYGKLKCNKIVCLHVCLQLSQIANDKQLLIIFLKKLEGKFPPPSLVRGGNTERWSNVTGQTCTERMSL